MLEPGVEPGKTCKKCGEWKLLTEFYPHSCSADGYRYRCRPCMVQDQCEYFKTKRGKEAKRRGNRKYSQTEQGREATRIANRKYYESHHQQTEAHSAVRAAVEDGVLPHISKRICADCGERQARLYHHDSYDEVDWLKVTPLCYICHGARHPKGS